MGPARQRQRILEDTATLRQIVTVRPFPPPSDRSRADWKPIWDLFVRRYETAMVRYVDTCLRGIRGRAPATDESIDVVRDFLAQAMEDGRLSAAGPELRTFRGWLATLLRRHVLDYIDTETAKKRGGGITMVGLDAIAGESSREGDPAARALHEEIVNVAIPQALARLRERDEISAEIIEDLRRTNGVGSDDLGALLAIPADRLAARKHKARREFGKILLEEIRDLCIDDEDFDELLAAIDPYLP